MKKALIFIICTFSVIAVQPAFGTNASGLPNKALTPGEINPSITQSNILSTICVHGYTKTIRPPATYTTSLKIRQLANGYTENGITLNSYYEEDHLIPLELGGHPTSEKNLWPEPWNDVYGAHKKDQLENKLHALVCSGEMLLKTAQGIFASNWVAGYKKYANVLTHYRSSSTKISSKSLPASSSSNSWPSGATGECVDGTFTFSTGHRGACSHHGGVQQWR